MTAKASGYQQLDGFHKEQNGLFHTHVKINVNGFIWASIGSKEMPEVPWEEHFRDVDKQDKYKEYNLINTTRRFWLITLMSPLPHDAP